MEETNHKHNSAAQRSAATAEQLRALHEQANESLIAHRRHLSDMETEINHRVKQIAEEIAHDLTDAHSEKSVPEVEDLSALLKQAVKDQEEIVEDLAQLNKQKKQQSEELAAKTELLKEATSQLKAMEGLLAERNNLLTGNDRQLAEKDDQQAITRSQLEEKEQRLEEAEKILADKDHRLAEKDERLAATYAQLEEKEQRLEEAEKLLAETDHRLAGKDELLAEKDGLLAGKDELLAERMGVLDLLQQEHQRTRDQLVQKTKQLEDSRNSLEKAQDEPCEACHQLQQHLDGAEEKCCQLQEQNGSLEKERDESHHALQEAIATQEKTSQALGNAEAKLQELDDLPDLGEELQQTRRKFELALADVQKLKHQNTELQEELSHRPEADEDESPELVSLRAERDAIAARVVELESVPAPVIDVDQQQAMDDLQRRFEMAVDDVRELKQENAELRKKVSSSDASSAASASDGPLDWQAQKALLLASLAEEDGESITVERKADRSTIEGTISITDRVVADKDREIEELRAQLQSQSEEQPAQVSQEQIEAAAREELFNGDELIREERARLEQIQDQWKEKLREAELSLSVERAKLAREQASLKEKLATLENMPPAASKAADEKPRRRWLAALGIKEEEEN